MARDALRVSDGSSDSGQSSAEQGCAGAGLTVPFVLFGKLKSLLLGTSNASTFHPDVRLAIRQVRHCRPGVSAISETRNRVCLYEYICQENNRDLPHMVGK